MTISTRGFGMVNLLIIEAYFPLASLYRLEFEDEGYRVFLAQNSQAALGIASREDIDVAIIDEQLSDNEVEALIQELKERLPNMHPVCSVSTVSTKSYIALCDETYTKSFDLAQLKETVERVLASFGNFRSIPHNRLSRLHPE